MEIDIEKLRTITNLIFEHITNDLKVKKIELKQDYYWNIQSEHLYDMSKDPAEFTAGQLYDDWDFLTKVEGREEAVALMFVHLAPLLRYVGEEVGQ